MKITVCQKPVYTEDGGSAFTQADTTVEWRTLSLTKALSQSSSQYSWLDIEFNPEDSNDLSQLLEHCGCHKLAICDALRRRHPPKFESFGEQLFLLYRGIHESSGPLDFEHQQIGFFVTENLLITVHPKTVISIERFKNSAQLPELLTTPLALALSIIHTSAGLYLDNMLAFEDHLSDAEDCLYTTSGEKTLGNLASYKAKLIKLKRIFNYHKSLAAEMRLLNDNSKLAVSVSPHILNDVFDRLERLYSLSQMHYDICADMIDSYISITSHQLNTSMRILTVITAIFVPLSFLAGIYGMNFQYIPELQHAEGYFILLGVMATLATGSLLLFKRKGWF
jgi:magnesium transporter